MEKITLGNYTLIKMDVQQFDAEYGAGIQEEYGDDVAYVCWAELQDDSGETVGVGMENMFICTDNTYKYTSRGFTVSADFSTCLRVILAMEEL